MASSLTHTGSARIAYTPGEPAGIGPDLVLLARNPPDCERIVIGDPGLIARRAGQLGLDVDIVLYEEGGEARQKAQNPIKVLPVELIAPERPGHPDPANAPYVLRTIEIATRLCLDSRIEAMVTGPVHKGVINTAGIPFSGHTEFIAAISGGAPVMMLATPGLRVALATTHIPVQQISQTLTQSRLHRVLSVLHDDLRNRFGIDNPRILVCGLNPHAGEDGHLGREEIEVITPVLERFRAQARQVIGPLPADTLFTRKHLDQADAVLAMYHDQGLPVLKYAGFGRAVNITLGLPLIRTSVDHGTALDLAGSGKISTGSLEYAFQVAIEMAVARN